jgi:predicted enzyme related to lactoylglutathione lyase
LETSERLTEDRRQSGYVRCGAAGFMNLPDATVPGLGGGVLAEPMDVPKVGRIAVRRDPQGATFGIIKPDPAS